MPSALARAADLADALAANSAVLRARSATYDRLAADPAVAPAVRAAAHAAVLRDAGTIAADLRELVHALRSVPALGDQTLGALMDAAAGP